MSEHTKEPWAIRRGHSTVEVITVAGLSIAQTIGDVYWKNFSDESLANAHRIVACVNALAGIPTSDIPSIMEEVKSVLVDLRSIPNAYGPLHQEDEQKFTRARALLAKLEGRRCPKPRRST